MRRRGAHAEEALRIVDEAPVERDALQRHGCKQSNGGGSPASMSASNSGKGAPTSA
jgi:hypothetical protein